MVAVGQLVAVGRTSEVFEYGAGSVVKVPRPTVPARWASYEARFTKAVRTCGVRAPEVLDLVTVNDRDAIVFERIEGPSMWEKMLSTPREVPALARELAAVQREIQQSGLPDQVPDLIERSCLKISDAKRMIETDRMEACEILRSLPRGAALLHGDLHPGNVLMSAAGPVVIDWFDTAIGHPLADVIRSTILIRSPAGGGELAHLPNAPPGLLNDVLRHYLPEFSELMAHGSPTIGRWEAVLAASRIAERAQDDEDGLIALWEARASGTTSQELASAMVNK